MEEEVIKSLLHQIIKNQNDYLGIKELNLTPKWSGGTLVVKPKNPELKSVEIPIDQFFKKVISVREKLRVLEQKINNHPKLEDAEKVDLQQYITRCYGSLTTFNILFGDDKDKFRGQSEG